MADMKGNTIACDNCGNVINVDEILVKNTENRIRAQFAAENKKKETDLEKKLDELKRQEAALKAQSKSLEEEAEERVEELLRAEKKQLEIRLKKKLEAENQDRLEMLEEELKEKAEKLKELNAANAKIAKLERDKAGLAEEIEAKLQRQLNDTLAKEKAKIKQQVDDQNELRIKELQLQLEAQKKLTEEMKKKQEQGSMQMQGEVQELAIEEYLEQAFPFDDISEVGKGARGADCVQTVHTRQKQNCGKIYYESKRTKAFQPTWIEKFKEDMRSEGADIGVIVTEAMPKDMTGMGMKDGIYICTYNEFKGLSHVLRQTVVQISNALSSQENKGDKMELLYTFLTGNEFKMQVEAIVEGFSAMQAGLTKEKRAMQKIWKEREKQIEKVITSTIDMYGAIKGIAGSAIQNIDALELDSDLMLED
jgi:hypothetical protein